MSCSFRLFGIWIRQGRWFDLRRTVILGRAASKQRWIICGRRVWGAPAAKAKSKRTKNVMAVLRWRKCLEFWSRYCYYFSWNRFLFGGNTEPQSEPVSICGFAARETERRGRRSEPHTCRGVRRAGAAMAAASFTTRDRADTSEEAKVQEK